mgnify:CR=1 FL=1
MKIKKKYRVMGQVFETEEKAKGFLEKLEVEEAFCINGVVFLSREDAQREALASEIEHMFCNWGRDKEGMEVARRAVNIMEVYHRGLQAGDYCSDVSCNGKMREGEKEGGCSCHNNPPCSYCCTEALECNECGKRLVIREGAVIEDDFEEVK